MIIFGEKNLLEINSINKSFPWEKSLRKVHRVNKCLWKKALKGWWEIGLQKQWSGVGLPEELQKEYFGGWTRGGCEEIEPKSKKWSDCRMNLVRNVFGIENGFLFALGKNFLYKSMDDQRKKNHKCSFLLLIKLTRFFLPTVRGPPIINYWPFGTWNCSATWKKVQKFKYTCDVDYTKSVTVKT